MAGSEYKCDITSKTPLAPCVGQDGVLQIILYIAALGVTLVIEWLRDPFAFF